MWMFSSSLLHSWIGDWRDLPQTPSPPNNDNINLGMYKLIGA